MNSSTRFDLDALLSEAAKAGTADALVRNMARALNEVTESSLAPKIVLAVAERLVEEWDMTAHQLRRNFPMGGTTHDLVMGLVEQAENS